MVLPAPAGPTIRRWWPPAAATSSAWRPKAWPRTSARSGTGRCGGWTATGGRGGHGESPPSTLTSVRRSGAVRASARLTKVASCAHAGGTTTPAVLSAPTSGNTPGTLLSDPSRPSSPMKASCLIGSVAIWTSAARTPRAMARSNPEPALRKPEGARLTVILFWGQVKPLDMMAARTRSRASRQDASGSPTTRKPGSPLLTCTSTSTG